MGYMLLLLVGMVLYISGKVSHGGGCGALTGLSWPPPGALTGLSWGSHGASVGLSWGFREAAMRLSCGFWWGCHGVVMRLLWASNVGQLYRNTDMLALFGGSFPFVLEPQLSQGCLLASPPRPPSPG